jgi:hypothetical protein
VIAAVFSLLIATNTAFAYRVRTRAFVPFEKLQAVCFACDLLVCTTPARVWLLDMQAAVAVIDECMLHMGLCDSQMMQHGYNCLETKCFFWMLETVNAAVCIAVLWVLTETCVLCSGRVRLNATRIAAH